jgi:hypothetical protein
MIKNALILLALLATLQRAAGQVDSCPPPPVEVDFLRELQVPDLDSRGEVRVQGDERVERLMKLMISVNKQGYAFPGYRVQILSTSASRLNVDSLQRYACQFEGQFPGTRAYLQYIDPDFKIRVGNFKTKIEAIPLLKKIRKKYPSSYIVRETIHLKDLLPRETPGEEPGEGEEDLNLVGLP